MNKAQVQQEIAALRRQIEHYNRRYYQEHESDISDLDFDNLLARLDVLEAEYPEFKIENSPTQRVGSNLIKHFITVRHQRPMISLSNTYSAAELEAFDQRVAKSLNEAYEYVCELKFDGVAISILYENGKLKQAITRGDGLQGDDITANIKTIGAIPLTVKAPYLPPNFEVRGEIFLTHKRFKALNQNILQENERRNLEGKKPLSFFANPRNTVSGTLKLQDPNLVAQRRLNAYIYTLLIDDNPLPTHFDTVKKLAEWGFNVCPHYALCSNLNEVQNFIGEWDEKRLKLPYDIDGIVLKVNALNHQNRLGTTAKSPRWAIAYKYSSEAVQTVLKSVDYQVGRTGSITPVANLVPVLLGGTVVKRASLHNANEIARLKLCLGDTVYVEKGGEIIPQIKGVNYSLRPKTADEIKFIKHCPACQTALIRPAREVAYYCPNTRGCKPQIIRQVQHFIQRNALNIENLGIQTIKQLVEQNYIKNPADLYELSLEQLLQLERFAAKSAENLITAIAKSKQTGFAPVLYGLGIRFVGLTVAKKLSQHFPDFKALQSASLERLENIAEIGTKIVESLHAYLSDPANQILIKRLEQHLNLTEEPQTQTPNSSLSGKNVVISGVFENLSRANIKELLKQNNAKVLSAVSKNTDFVLAGAKMGPAKRQKAEQLGVPIITLEAFLKMIDY